MSVDEDVSMYLAHEMCDVWLWHLQDKYHNVSLVLAQVLLLAGVDHRARDTRGLKV